ncbi:MAG: sigma-E factor negative regulatory protein [Pseudomonadota bacterium]
MNEAIREQLSAYVDGELPDNEAELLIRRMSQDSTLRTEVAEYLALGRIMRDNLGLAAADSLNERVAAQLDDSMVEDAAAESASVPSRSLKLLGGAAIAATVALAAIFSLQQTASVDDTVDAPSVADATVVPAGTSQQEKQRFYLMNHAEMSTDLGANGIDPRLVTLELDEEVIVDPDADATTEDEIATQP